MSTPPATPRPAATVMIVRSGSKHSAAGLELLMLRRGAEARFMPGVWVFAGGVVDPEDFARAAAEPELAGPAPVETEELAHRIGASREASEEAGLTIDPAGIVPWSRWITPEAVPIRFDTRFYIARAPGHARPQADGVEMDAACWIEAQAAIAGHGDGSFPLSFPTIRHLEGLIEFGSVDELFAAASTRRVEPVLPTLSGDLKSFTVTVPGDGEYQAGSPGLEDAPELGE